MALLAYRGREPVLLAVGLIAVIFSGLYVATGTVHQAWQNLVDGATSPGFADVRTITHSIDCLLSGHDPYIAAACDPWGRLYNYPSIWLHLGVLGISSAFTNVIGLSLIIVTIISLLFLFHTQTVVSGVIVFCALCSPPILFAVERGNTDLVIFSTLVISCTLLSMCGHRTRDLVMSGIIISLTILKIYPVAASSIFAWKRKGYVYSIIVASLAIAALFFTAGLHELKIIAENTPQYTCFSYGGLRAFLGVANAWIHPTEDKVGSFAFDLSAGLVKAGPLPLLTDHLRLVSFALTVAVALAAIYYSLRVSTFIFYFAPALDSTSAHGTIAISCLSIFCFTFMLGSNIDYRLVFLLGVLSAVLRVYDVKRRWSLLIVPGTIVMFFWLSRLSTGLLPFLLYELLDWMLFAGGVAWLAVSLDKRCLVSVKPRIVAPRRDQIRESSQHYRISNYPST